MFYGIAQSTDMRCKDTQIKKFTSKKSLLKWMSQGSGNYTHSDPELARNYHHTFKYGYEYHGRIDYKHAIFSDQGTPTYPRTKNDQIASYLYQYAKQIDNENYR